VFPVSGLGLGFVDEVDLTRKPNPELETAFQVFAKTSAGSPMSRAAGVMIVFALI
jgi:hypothetical protein